MNSEQPPTQWATDVRAALAVADSEALGALFAAAVADVGRATASRWWQQVASSYDGSAQTG